MGLPILDHYHTVPTTKLTAGFFESQQIPSIPFAQEKKLSSNKTGLLISILQNYCEVGSIIYSRNCQFWSIWEYLKRDSTNTVFLLQILQDSLIQEIFHILLISSLNAAWLQYSRRIFVNPTTISYQPFRRGSFLHCVYLILLFSQAAAWILYRCLEAVAKVFNFTFWIGHAIHPANHA